MTESVQQQILDIISKHCEVDPATLTLDSRLTDLGMDSLEAIEVIFDIEEHFDITLPEKDPDFESDTAAGLLKAVEAGLAAKNEKAEAG